MLHQIALYYDAKAVILEEDTIETEMYIFHIESTNSEDKLESGYHFTGGDTVDEETNHLEVVAEAKVFDAVDKGDTVTLTERYTTIYRYNGNLYAAK